MSFVASNARALDGKRLRTRGFIQLDFEAPYFAASRWDFELDRRYAVIYSVGPDAPLAHQFSEWACTRKDVSIEGLFHEGARSDDGRFVDDVSGTIWISAIRELKPEDFLMPGDYMTDHPGGWLRPL